MRMKRLLYTPRYPSLVVGSVSGESAWKSCIAGVTSAECDVLELRADALGTGADIDALLATPCPLPVLVTTRHADEGGCRAIPEPERVALAEKLLPLASAIDWEIAHLASAAALIAEAKSRGVVVIASAHDFERTPSLEYMKERERIARAAGAHVVKFAFRLNSVEDIMTGVELLRCAEGPMAVMGMGPLGAVSRLLYAQHGSVLTYGYLGTTPTAPGQWAASLCKLALSSLPRV